jgi:predicted membrane protein
MTDQASGRATGRLVAGGLLISVGLLFTLDNFGIVRAGDLFQYWPLLLVGAGLTKILQSRQGEHRAAGFVLLAVGVIFLLRTFDVVWFRVRDLWPLLFLVVGGLLIWRSARRRIPGENSAERALAGAREGLAASRPSREGPVDAGSVLNEFAFMGGGERVVRSQDFRGGEVTAILGGFEIDLRGAAIAGDSATIEVFAFWGGIELRVPEDWNVAVHGTPILGAVVNSAKAGIGTVPTKTLVVRGSAIMGGVEVKN